MAAVKMDKVLCFLALSVVFITVSCDITTRDIKVTLFPDCQTYNGSCEQAKKEGINVVYAKAFSANDTLLYAFSTISTPAIVLARVTGEDTDMHFNWTKLLSNGSLEDAITFSSTSSKVDYKFGVAFTRLIEYNDVDDSADLQSEASSYNSSKYWNIKDFNQFNWVVEPSNSSSNVFVFTASSIKNISEHNSSYAGNWTISFRFTVQQDSGRSAELPSLKYGANETLFDFAISNYPPSYDNSRFAVEVVLASQSIDSMNIGSIDSIDDEYSPGVFEMINWLSDPSQEQSSGFVQWKPVCYNSNSRGRTAATKVKHYSLSGLKDREDMTELLELSIISGLFGKDLFDSKVVAVQTTNISFGLSQDEFYVKNNYTAWTAAIGYGNPPEDTISMMVIIIISAGLGLPVIILIFGGIYTCVKKSKKKTQYEAINSDTVSSRTQLLVN